MLGDINGIPNWVIEQTIDESKKLKQTGTKHSGKYKATFLQEFALKKNGPHALNLTNTRIL